MKKSWKENWKVYLLFVVITEIVGGISAWITNGAMESFSQMAKDVPLMPPDILFPIVWSILYALMGISAARIWLTSPSKERTYGLMIYVIQLGINFLWSIIFFNLQAYGLAFIWLVFLWILIILMIREFNKIDSIAAKLQIPYLLWVTFAGYLNFMIWWINR